MCEIYEKHPAFKLRTAVLLRSGASRYGPGCATKWTMNIDLPFYKKRSI